MWERVFIFPLPFSSERQFPYMPLGLTGRRDFLLAGPCQPLISIFFAHFQVETAGTITSTQTDVTVTLTNYRMILLTPAIQQKNVTCTATALPSKAAIYLCRAVNGVWLQSPSRDKASSGDGSRSDQHELLPECCPSAEQSALAEKHPPGAWV